MKNNLLELRKSEDMTQNDVCTELKKAGCYISRSTYSKYETGARALPCEILVELVKCFNTTANYILGLNDCK